LLLSVRAGIALMLGKNGFVEDAAKLIEHKFLFNARFARGGHFH
jgi:hypothetical protein